ncbi:hypothetical protein DAI22_11g057600 [Oryza sativa Japonica Group]|nr:hypothetical protein DAI22_11g057600 [Oryza sativa Japonica Group]
MTLQMARKRHPPRHPALRRSSEPQPGGKHLRRRARTLHLRCVLVLT